MAFRKEMIEYTAFVIQNSVDPSTKIFKDQSLNLDIDDEYIKHINSLKQLYVQIINLYNNIANTNQYMEVVKHLALNRKIETTSHPLLTKFYYEFVKLIDYIIPGIPRESLRSLVIKHFVQLPLDQIIVKYDYHFTNTPIDRLKIHLVEGSAITNLFAFVDYYVVALIGSVVISDYKTTKLLTLPEVSEINRFFIPLREGKFVFMTFNPTGIYIFDFNTKESQFKELKIDNDVSDVKILPGKDKIIVSTYDDIFVIDSYTLEIENTIHSGVVDDGLIVFEDQIISLDIDADNSIISFWNHTSSTPLKIIKISEGAPIFFKKMGIKLIVGFNRGKIVIVDGDDILTIDDYELQKEADDDYENIIRDILVQGDNFIVLFDKYIRLFNNAGIMIREMEVEEVKYIFLLPNSQNLAINNEFNRIYDLETEHIYGYEDYKTEDGDYRVSVSPIGKLILIKGNGDLIIYE